MSRITLHSCVIAILLISNAIVACTSQQSSFDTQAPAQSSKTPGNISTNGNADSCMVTSHVKICINFAFTDKRGTFIGLEYQPLDIGIRTLPESFSKELVDEEIFLLDEQGNTHTQRNVFASLPSEVSDSIGQDTTVLSFSPTEPDSIKHLIIPNIAYVIPVNTDFKITLPPGINPGEVLDIDIPVEVAGQTIRFQSAEIVDPNTETSFTIMEGVKTKDDKIMASPPDNNLLDLFIKSEPIDFDDCLKIVGLGMEEGSNGGFNPNTQQLLLSYRFPEGENSSFDQEHNISFHIRSAWIIEQGPFDIEFQTPHGDENFLSNIKQASFTEENPLPGDIYFALYAPDSHKLLRQQAACLATDSTCPDAKIIYTNFPLTYSLFWSPDGKQAVLLDCDNQLLRRFITEEERWETLDEGVSIGNDEVGVWSPDSTWYAFTITKKSEPEKYQVMLLQPDTSETFVFGNDIEGYIKLLGWQDANSLIFRNHTYSGDGTPQGKIFRFNLRAKTWQELLDWPKDSAISLSPQGRFFAFSDSKVQNEIFIMDIDENDIRSIPIPGHFIQWSPDGQWISTINFYEDQDMHGFDCDVHIAHPDGTESQQVFQGASCSQLVWGPNSNHILVNGNRNYEGGPQLFLVSIANKTFQEISIPGMNSRTGRMEIFWP